LDGNRPRTHPSPKPHRKPARKPSASKSGPRGRDLHNPLTDITRRLEVISAVAVTAEVALRAQNCEQSADIAYDFSPGKEDGVCIWKSDVQVLTVLAVNRT
jgi:hypothetical protein